MLLPRQPYDQAPNTLPFTIIPLEEEAKIKLIAVLIGSISMQNPLLDGDELLDTANRCAAHFEVVSSATENGFIESYDEIFSINGYEMRVFYPAVTGPEDR